MRVEIHAEIEKFTMEPFYLITRCIVLQTVIGAQRESVRDLKLRIDLTLTTHSLYFKECY